MTLPTIHGPPGYSDLPCGRRGDPWLAMTLNLPQGKYCEFERCAFIVIRELMYGVEIGQRLSPSQRRCGRGKAGST